MEGPESHQASHVPSRGTGTAENRLLIEWFLADVTVMIPTNTGPEDGFRNMAGLIYILSNCPSLPAHTSNRGVGDFLSDWYIIH